MSSPVSSVVNAPTVLNSAGPEYIDPATSSKIGSITYDPHKNGYDLEWELRADFNTWLTHEQAAVGIELRVSKTWQSKTHQLYSTCETFCYVCNGTGGK